MLWLPLIVGVALIITTIQVRMREDGPEWAVLLAIAFVIIVSLGIFPRLGEMVEVFVGLAKAANVDSIYLAPVLKTIGIAYVTSFGVQICKEAGEDAIGQVVELAGKVVILLVALPLVQVIFSSLLGLLN